MNKVTRTKDVAKNDRCRRCEMNLPVMPSNAIVTRFSLDNMDSEEQQLFTRLNELLKKNGGVTWNKLNELWENSYEEDKSFKETNEWMANDTDSLLDQTNSQAPEEKEWELIERNKTLLSKGVKILDNRSGNIFNKDCVAMPVVFDFPLIASQIGGIKNPQNPTDEEVARMQKYALGLITPQDILLSKGVRSHY